MKTFRYLYNAENQRIEQDVDAFHGAGNSLPGSDGTYETQEAYVYDAGEVTLVLKRTDHTLVGRYLWGPGPHQVLAEDTPGGTPATHLFVADAEGSVRQVVDAGTGSVISTVDYDAFGNATASGTVTTLPRFAYTGQQADPATGLYYYGARYYDPMAGRFINQDPALEGSN
ncbi:MAG: RHS repeat-associated core domain-containing protein, partial [Tepidisphaerales bacterium]